MIQSITWSFGPEMFTVFGITLRWYGFLFAMAFVAGYYITRRDVKRLGKDEKFMDSLLIYMLLGAIIGARLGHCFFYEPDYYLRNPIKILYTWEGGLASHGGAIGILFSLWLFSRKYKVKWLWIVDRISGVTALGGFFIRMGNLMNSEIIGTQTSVPWAFIFTAEDSVPRHPAQLYEAICYLIIFFFLRFIDKKHNFKAPNGYIVSWFLILVFGVRFFVEFIKEAQVGFEESMFLNMGQLLSVPFVLLGAGYLVYLHRKNLKQN